MYLELVVLFFVVFALSHFVKGYTKYRTWTVPAARFQLLPHSSAMHFSGRTPKWFCPVQLPSLSLDVAELYEKLNTPIVQVGNWTTRAIYTNDADVVKQLCVNTKTIEKPVEVYKSLDLWGSNIITTTGDNWKRHRTCCNPGFSDVNVRGVSDVAVTKMNELLSVWKDGDTLDLDETTTVFTLSVIVAAAFGKTMYLDGVHEEKLAENHKMTFAETISVISVHVITRAALPDWAWQLPLEGLKKIDLAFKESTEYLHEIIKTGSIPALTDKKDILSLLLKAKAIEGEKALSDKEILADVYMFLIAGHETTARSLSFALRALAFYPEVQEQLYQQTKEILGDREFPTYEDLPNLTMAWNVFWESLRLFPPAALIPKVTMKEMEVGGHMFAARTSVNIDVYNLHRNPKYWSQPNDFIPSRWNADIPDEKKDIGVKEKYCYVPFSAGQRSCIGKKFAETEAIIFLSMFALNYKWEIKDPKQNNEEQLFAWKSFITTQPLHNVPFKITARK